MTADNVRSEIYMHLDSAENLHNTIEDTVVSSRHTLWQAQKAQEHCSRVFSPVSLLETNTFGNVNNITLWHTYDPKEREKKN